MNEYIAWTTPLMQAESHIKRAGELMEDKKTRDAMIELAKAQEAIANVQHWVLTRKA
jgi:hypothetical protein